MSVRSAVEAEAAVAGGASIIDIKEPARGPLGRADRAVWRAVRAAVPETTPISAALGELDEWPLDGERAIVGDDAFDRRAGIAFWKLGLARAPSDWRARWHELRGRLNDDWRERPVGGSPAWVAVVYLDHEAACAPDPRSVLRAAMEPPACAGALFDTWDKSRRPEWDRDQRGLIALARELGLFVALAGSLDEATIRSLQQLRPDVFAVRGAACRGGERRGPIDRERVARLAGAVLDADLST